MQHCKFFALGDSIGGMQFPKHQIDAINNAIQSIPEVYRQRFRTSITKSKVSGPGSLRMIIADPSECVESESILPILRNKMNVLEERPYGGNVLMYALKDISHHFIKMDPNKEAVLKNLFALEDAYLNQHPSDFVFGVYKKN